MPAYCLFENVTVTDPDAMAEYAAQAAPLVEAHGGRYVVKGGPVEVMEGSWSPGFPVLIEFPTLEDAKRWYASAAYEPVKALRLGAGTFNAVFMDGA